jgi:hypothetical protein
MAFLSFGMSVIEAPGHGIALMKNIGRHRNWKVGRM